MNIHIGKSCWLLSTSFVVLCTTSSVEARVCVLGHSGVVEDPNKVAIIRPRGYGLDYWDNTGKPTWIHYSIPTDADAKEYSEIRISYIRKQCGGIEKVSIYDGWNLVKSFDWYKEPDWPNRYLSLKLDTPLHFWNGIGVTIDPVGTWDLGCSGSKITIHSVCAFEPQEEGAVILSWMQ